MLASAAGGGRLAIVTKGKKHRQTLHLYMLQVCLGSFLKSLSQWWINRDRIGGHALAVKKAGGLMCLCWERSCTLIL